ncbi:MAG TPA: hypothetical protein VNJ01_17995 [Bacteriovoracaceae bacterium]|nr:hypothetical protein [Bacteriovoracaceae bacterium]
MKSQIVFLIIFIIILISAGAAQACSPEDDFSSLNDSLTRFVKKQFKITTRITFLDPRRDQDGEESESEDEAYSRKKYAVLKLLTEFDYYGPGTTESGGGECPEKIYHFREFRAKQGKRYCKGMIKSERYSLKHQVVYKDCSTN